MMATIWSVWGGFATFAEALCCMITFVAVPIFYPLVFREKFKLTSETFWMMLFAVWYGPIFIVSWGASDIESAYKLYFSLAEFVVTKFREKDAAYRARRLARKTAISRLSSYS